MRLAKVNHSKEQRWRKYVFRLQGGYIPTGKSWLHTWQVSEQLKNNNDEWHPVKNRKTGCHSPGKGKVQGRWDSLDRIRSVGLCWVLTAGWLLDRSSHQAGGAKGKEGSADGRKQAHWLGHFPQHRLCSLIVTKDYTRQCGWLRRNLPPLPEAQRASWVRNTISEMEG